MHTWNVSGSPKTAMQMMNVALGVTVKLQFAELPAAVIMSVTTMSAALKKDVA